MITLNHPQRHGAPQLDFVCPHLHYFPIASPRTSINVDLVARLQLERSKNCHGVHALVNLGIMTLSSESFALLGIAHHAPSFA
jgi:hypothetical protein